MKGIEAMIAAMIRMKPTDLKAMAEELSAGATKAFGDIAKMSETLKDIQERLERIENDGNQS